MSNISDEQINQIRQRSDIVDIISKYIPLIKKGRNYFGVCPFHDDTNPSLSVSPEKQIYKCFSCGAGGNVFTFLMDYESIPFLESVKKVSSIVGIPINIDFIKNEKNNEIYQMYNLAEKFYQNNLQSKLGEEALLYLKKRDIDEDIISHFNIGLALEKHSLFDLLKKKEYNHKDMLKSGLIEEGDYDVFKNRIIFPIKDYNGKTVAFSGRAIDDHQTPKYINTKETIIFRKGDLLYNYHEAKEESRITKKIIILEGFIDVISLYANGIKNTVATMGTALTKEQVKLIKRLNSEVIIMFDGDEAGIKASLTCADELIKIGVTPKIVCLEDNLDPDDYIKQKGLEKLNQKIENPINVLDFKINYFKKNKDLTDSVQMAEYVNIMIKQLEQIEDEVLKEITLKKLSNESNLDYNFLKNKIKEKKTVKIEPTEKQEDDSLLAEKHLIYYMLKSPTVINIYKKRVKFMPTHQYRIIALEISAYYDKYNSIEIADIFSLISKNEKIKKALNDVLSLNLKEKYTIEEIEDYVNAIEQYVKKYETIKLKEKLNETSNMEEKMRLAEQIRLMKVEEE